MSTLATTKVYEDEYITVEFNAEHNCIAHVFHKPYPDQVLRDALNAGTEAMKKYGVCKWLSDDRKGGPLSPENQEWGQMDWNPRTLKAGWKYWAMVVPEQVVAAGSMMEIIEIYYNVGLIVQVFSTAEEAAAWLDTKEC